MSLKFIVVAEAREDFETVTALADRVFLEQIEWLQGYLQYQREWITEYEGHPLTWMSIKILATRFRIRAHGFLNEEPAYPYAQAARRAIRVALAVFGSIDGILLICDADDQPERRDGLEQAREVERGDFPVVLGCAIVERECWILSGFDPVTDEEESLLQQERQNLGFDPRLRSHALTACKDDRALKSAKRVCAVLTDNNLDRQRDCWNKTNLTLLRERGQENGLHDYLIQVEERLVPRFIR